MSTVFASRMRPLVLFIGESEAISSLWGHICQQKNWELVQAKDGYSALELALKRPPLIVIVKYPLPDVLWRDFCCALGKIEPLRALVVIGAESHLSGREQRDFEKNTRNALWREDEMELCLWSGSLRAGLLKSKSHDLVAKLTAADMEAEPESSSPTESAAASPASPSQAAAAPAAQPAASPANWEAIGTWAVLGVRAQVLAKLLTERTQQLELYAQTLAASKGGELSDQAELLTPPARETPPLGADFAQLTKGGPERSTQLFDLRSLLEEIVNQERYYCGSEWPGEFLILVDRQVREVVGSLPRLRLLWTIALDNARRAVNAKVRTLSSSKRSQRYRGQITLEAGPCADGILCEVSDNALGVGSAYLDPQHPQSIFQPGVSHWGRSQLPGLGLAVAKTIVQECQGRISAHNNEQGGLTVSWFLPSPAYEEANSGERIVEEAGGVIISSQPAVLIVEDEIMSFSMLRDYLESDGYYVEFARSGEECLQRLQEDKRQFDCILCDYNMPRMNGLELYQKVGEIDPKLQERFIFMTGYNVSNLLKTTGRKYLFKPLFKKELLEAVQACLEHSEEHHG